MGGIFFLPAAILSFKSNFLTVKMMLHGTIRNDYFSATHRCNVGSVLEPFKTMSQQCCNASVALKIVIASRLV